MISTELPTREVIDRRGALAVLGAAIVAVTGCGKSSSLTGPGGISDPALGFNVQPLGGGALALQLQAIDRLRLHWIRITLGLTSPTIARSYVGAAPDVLGLVGDLAPGPIDARAWPSLLEATLRRYPDIQAAELLNEPESTNGLTATQYVQDFLRPGFELIRDRFPGIAVVAAAPVGDPRKTPDRLRQQTDAGADEFCDFRAVHAYFSEEGALAATAGATGRPILVTETGTRDAGQQVRWFTDVVPRIRLMLGAHLVFWYDLLESANAFPGFSVISNVPGPGGQPQPAPGSGLYSLLTGGASQPLRAQAPRRR